MKEANMQHASLVPPVSRGATAPPATTVDAATGRTLQRWTLFAPVLVILTSFAIFRLTKSTSTDRVVQLTGFAFYWIAGGIVFPLVLLGRRGYGALLERRDVTWNARLVWGVVALFLPALFGFFFAFPYMFPAESALLLPGLAVYALLNGTFEEVFWRGLFLEQFRGDPWRGIVYPSVMFGAWQLVPWALFDSWLRPPAVVLLALSIAVGLLFGWVAQRTGSIRWTVMAHVLMNLSGIGAFVIFGPPG
jgi:membrane protease YdiL (CAAX protease family)